jgi:hypothetical protein
MTEDRVDAQLIRWKLFGIIMALIGVAVVIMEFLGMDSIIALYIWAVTTCGVGTILFMWLRKMGHVSVLLTCVSALFTSGLWAFGLALYARYLFPGDNYETFLRTYLWKTRVVPMITVFTYIVVYLYVRLKYGKDRSER